MSYANKRRQSSDGGEGGGANWMDTYGDLVTLLLCFFVLLFAFSSMDASKWESLVGAFTGTPVLQFQPMDPLQAVARPIETIVRSGGGGVTMEDLEGTAEVSEAFMSIYTGIKEYMEEQGIAVEIEADFDAMVILIRFRDHIFFESGEAQILPEATELLDHMAGVLGEYATGYAEIEIEGHTDSIPISTQQYRNNRALSSARANNVIEYLENTGNIESEKIFGTGYGEYRPAADNDTPEGRAANRRVDFIIQGVIEMQGG